VESQDVCSLKRDQRHSMVTRLPGGGGHRHIRMLRGRPAH